MSRPSANQGLYAGFWRRFAASVVDGVVLYFCVLIGILVVAGSTRSDAVTSIVVLVIPVVYLALCHASTRQATPGKRALGIKVTDLEGKRIGLGRSFARAVLTLVSMALLGLGFLPAAFTPKRVAIDDMLAGTLVVNATASSDDLSAGRSGVMALTTGVWLAIMLPVAAAIGAGYIAISAFHDYEARARAGSGAAVQPAR